MEKSNFKGENDMSVPNSGKINNMGKKTPKTFTISLKRKLFPVIIDRDLVLEDMYIRILSLLKNNKKYFFIYFYNYFISFRRFLLG